MKATNPKSLLFVVFLLVCAGVGLRFYTSKNKHSLVDQIKDKLHKNPSQALKDRIRAEILSGQFSNKVEIPQEGSFELKYALDPELQAYVRDYFRIYEPDFGALVVMNAETGEVLTNYSFQNPKIAPIEGVHNLALEPIVPAASIFKIVTAGASLDLGRISPDSVLPINGSHHTLYKKNVFSQQINRWTQFITLRQAFARSINSAFAKIGLQTMQPENLKIYAEKFGFNRNIESDVEGLPLASSIQFDPSDTWNIASVASGYDHHSRMSALHGALLASVAVNNGLMIKPRFLKQIKASNSEEVLFESKPDLESIVISQGAAREMRELMQETIENGTSRRSFRRVAGLKNIEELEMGGKTGSIDSDVLKGRCDWFVGYAKGNNFKYTIAALTVNQNFWKVKSSYLAGKIFEHLYRKNKANNFHSQQALGQDKTQSAKDL